MEQRVARGRGLILRRAHYKDLELDVFECPHLELVEGGDGRYLINSKMRRHLNGSFAR